MAHIPYGYKIVNGKAEVDEEQAEGVRKLFDGYIAGLGLKPAAENAGLEIFHGSAECFETRITLAMNIILPSSTESVMTRRKKLECRGHLPWAGSENCRLHQSQWRIQGLPCPLLRENLQIHLNRQNMPTA